MSPNQNTFIPTGTGNIVRAAQVSIGPSALQTHFQYWSTRSGITATRTAKNRGIHSTPLMKYALLCSPVPVFIRNHRSDRFTLVTSDARKKLTKYVHRPADTAYGHASSESVWWNRKRTYGDNPP